jgi:leucyl/phenylalanyl-tRNA--protein transferase
MVLFTDHFNVSHSLKKKLKQVHRSMYAGGPWEIRFDSVFTQVIQACAAPRKGEAGTWISDDIMTGYNALHNLGYAHSSEVWLDDELVGGAYGVSIGHMFYGESMFARITDASKIALAYLVHFLKSSGVVMIDCQQETSHLASLGATPISRIEFLRILKREIEAPQIQVWKPIELFERSKTTFITPTVQCKL